MLVLCPYPVGVAPGQRLKYEQYFDAIEDNGVTIVVSPFMTSRFWTVAYREGFLVEKVVWTFVGYARRAWDLVRAPFYDVVYVFLWGTPFGPPIYERLLTWLQPRVIYDIDDMVFLPHSSRANSWLVALKGRTKSLFMMRHALHVITCTPGLTEVARQLNANVTDISSTIDTDSYRPIVSHSGDQPVVIGWSGSHSTSRYLHLVEPALRRITERFPVRILVIGDPTFRFDAIECEALPWNGGTEVEDLRRISIGIYPLPNEDWVLGKSGLKALQYMALGIPPVATAIGANFRVIDDGVSGFLVRSEDEWVERLTALIESPELRARMGRAGREDVERRFSVAANRALYTGIIAGVLHGEAPPDPLKAPMDDPQ